MQNVYDKPRPDWFWRSEGDFDLTDVWQEETDADNERGEIVTAHTRKDSQGFDFILGVSVVGKVTTYLDRNALSQKIGSRLYDVESMENA